MNSPNSPSDPSGEYPRVTPDPAGAPYFEGNAVAPPEQNIFTLSDTDRAWRSWLPRNVRRDVSDAIMAAKAYHAEGHINLANPDNPNKPHENPLIGKPNINPQAAAVNKVVEAIGIVTSRAGKRGPERDSIVRAMIEEVMVVRQPHRHTDAQVEDRLRRMDLRYAFVPAHLRLLYQAALEQAGDEKALRAGGILNPSFAQMLGNYLGIEPQSLEAQLAGGPSVVFSSYLEQLDFIIRLQAAMQIQHPKLSPTKQNPTGENIWADIIHMAGPDGSQGRPADSYLVARMHAYQTNVRAGVYNFPQPPQPQYGETTAEYEERYVKMLLAHRALVERSVGAGERQELLEAVDNRLNPLLKQIQHRGDEAEAAAQRERDAAAERARQANTETEQRNQEAKDRKKLYVLLNQFSNLVDPDQINRIRDEYEQGHATMKQIEYWLKKLYEMASQAQANAASGNQNTSGNANPSANSEGKEGADTPDSHDANTINADWREINDEPQTQPHPTPKPGMGTETSENRPGIWRTGGGDATADPERSN